MTPNAIQKNAVGWVPIDRNDILCFFRILMLSGYIQLPSYKMFWEEAPDVQQLVKSAMPQNKFYLIFKNIRFRPLMNMIQERSEKFAIMTKNVNVDESIIPYYENVMGSLDKNRNNEFL